MKELTAPTATDKGFETLPVFRCTYKGVGQTLEVRVVARNKPRAAQTARAFYELLYGVVDLTAIYTENTGEVVLQPT